MTVTQALELLGVVAALATSVLMPMFLIGVFKGTVLTTQAVHEARLGKLDEGVADKGRRLEQLGHDFARLEGRLDGAETERSRGHRV
jgi:hypothetical protein